MTISRTGAKNATTLAGYLRRPQLQPAERAQPRGGPFSPTGAHPVLRQTRRQVPRQLEALITSPPKRSDRLVSPRLRNRVRPTPWTTSSVRSPVPTARRGPTASPIGLVLQIVSGTQLAINIAQAVNDNATTGAVISASGSASGVKFTHGQTGTFPITITTFTAFNGGTGQTIPAGTTAQVQPNAYPAKYGTIGTGVTTASCSDFVVYPAGQTGATATAGTAATIIAYDNIYTGTCLGTVPTADWAYNTSFGATMQPKRSPPRRPSPLTARRLHLCSRMAPQQSSSCSSRLPVRQRLRSTAPLEMGPQRLRAHRASRPPT